MTAAADDPSGTGFGSAAWFSAAQAALRGVDTGDARLTLEHRVLDDGAALRYRLRIADGTAAIAPVPDAAGDAGADGNDADADLVLVQSAATAADVRAGRLGALEAIQSGRIEVHGDVRKLLAAAPAVAVVDEALSHLRP